VEIRRGTPVSPGVVIGPAFVLESDTGRIPRRFIMPEEADHEVERFEKALAKAAEELRILERRLNGQLHEDQAVADIFRAHLHVLEDPGLRERVVSHIRNKHFTPEYAVTEVLRRYATVFERVGDRYLAQRKADILDIEHRLLSNLLGEKRQDLAHLREPAVIVAQNLTPSQTVSLDRSKILAFVTDLGGRTSHTAILARALAIPAVVGLGSISSEVADGDRLVVDGSAGIVIIGPDDATIQRYQAREREIVNLAERVTREVHDLPCVTRDGRTITLKANIEFPEEVTDALAAGAAGIGLYRTEFLFHAAGGPPDEEAHYRAYCAALDKLQGRPLTIRCLDIGADKFPLTTAEPNPFLGNRSIRLLLRKPELLRAQLRAIYRASARGNVRFMFPLVSTVQELRQAKRMVGEVRTELDKNGIPYDPNVPVGTMIEVPSAALLADVLARECDFFSIGTNDLVQYTLAVDRDNAEVAHLFSPADPAVLRLIAMTVRAAKAANIPVAVCGEMAGDPLYTILLVGLGLDELSVGPKAIPELKRIIRAIASEDARRIAEHVLTLDHAGAVERYLDAETRKILPERY